MPYEMTFALYVSDQEKYAQYRAEIAPLLEATQGRFRYDVEVSRVLKSEAGHDINRMFVLQFPDRTSKGQFFQNAQYREIRARLFDKVVQMTIIAEYSIPYSDNGTTNMAGEIKTPAGWEQS